MAAVRDMSGKKILIEFGDGCGRYVHPATRRNMNAILTFLNMKYQAAKEKKQRRIPRFTENQLCKAIGKANTQVRLCTCLLYMMGIVRLLPGKHWNNAKRCVQTYTKVELIPPERRKRKIGEI